MFVAGAPGYTVRKHPQAQNPLAEASELEIRMGSATLERCPYAPDAYCGSLSRRLDPKHADMGTVAVHFEVDPHIDLTQQPLEPIVFQEGGPGYGSTFSRDGYLVLAGPLRQRHDVILMDQRGTGHSQAIDCPATQNRYILTQSAILHCGELLGDTSDLYGTGLAADDLDAILDVLGVGQIDLYGDSYGTYFSQTYSARHPDRLRALVLDGAYQVKDLDPWYPQTGVAMRYAFNVACQRAQNCINLPGSALNRLADLVRQVRVSPIEGIAQDGGGQLRQVRIDPVSLLYLSTSDALYYPLVRETDPAVRALTESGDALPLLRLIAENEVASASGGPGSIPELNSNGLFLAVSCQDYPQIYDMRSPFAERIVQRAASFSFQRQTNANIYYPFRLGEYAAVPLDYSLLNQCLTWPIPSASHPPGRPIPPDARFTAAPVLVLNGDMDTLTPALEGRAVLREYQHARQVLVHNTFHVSAIGDEDNCAQQLVRRFLESLDPGDTSCAAKIAEVRMVPRFATTAAQLDPATALPGNQGSATDLRVAAAAAYALGDVLDLYWVNYSGHGVGLRGGTWSYSSNASGDGYLFDLEQVRWTNDVTVSGRFTWDYYKPGTVTGQLAVSGPNGESGNVTISFDSREADAQATISGTIRGKQIVASMYAP
ncbi:MAG: alpha/beta fold hydrolase [Acidobacteriales bacterium]|nr:alpha/beta fold hydrolase [Terriglobales bacterium]